jgi:aryl-alcohol dehydrogenase-like predicted oxidoreductase
MKDRPARLSRIGFGVSGAHGTPLISRTQTVALIEQAVELGVTAFDTAPSYGAGEAERRLGEAVRRIGRDRLHISTKAGLSSYGLVGRRRDFRPDGIEASILTSLDRLGVEGVDTLFLHGAGPEDWTPALLERLRDLKSAGAFARLGAAGRGPELDAAMETGAVEAIMAPVHSFLSEAENARISRVGEAGLALVAIETSGDSPARLRVPRRAADLYALAKRLRAGPGRGRVSVEAGLSAALARRNVTCAFMTTTRSNHLEANAALA